MLLIAICAVSSQTAFLNAVFDNALLEGLPLPDSDQYFLEAISEIPIRIEQNEDLDYLRAFGLLAVYSLQRGSHNDLHRYLGLYHALVAQHSFHDQSRWPQSLTISEIDDRCRLFWCVYRLEVHSACVLGHVVRLTVIDVNTWPCKLLALKHWSISWRCCIAKPLHARS
jgi:hypothetical protein